MIEDKKVVPNSENPKDVFSLFETVKLSVSISPRIHFNDIRQNMNGMQWVVCKVNVRVSLTLYEIHCVHT